MRHRHGFRSSDGVVLQLTALAMYPEPKITCHLARKTLKGVSGSNTSNRTWETRREWAITSIKTLAKGSRPRQAMYVILDFSDGWTNHGHIIAAKMVYAARAETYWPQNGGGVCVCVFSFPEFVVIIVWRKAAHRLKQIAIWTNLLKSTCHWKQIWPRPREWEKDVILAAVRLKDLWLEIRVLQFAEHETDLQIDPPEEST